MKKDHQDLNDTQVSGLESSPTGSEVSSPSRRKFLGKLGTAATVTMAAGVLGGPSAIAEAGGFNSNPANSRVSHATQLRINEANADAAIPVPAHTTSGDETLYPDKSATFTKCVLQNYIGAVNSAAYLSFRKACNSGKPADWDGVILGGTRTLNGPQGAYAYDLEGLDSIQYGNAPGVGDPSGAVLVPPFDPVASTSFGVQLMEQYWASLLRDVAFTDYASNTTAQAAATELGAQATYRGPRDGSGNVTPDLLFRGPYAGESIGPYMSQFMILPTSMGAQPLTQQLTTYSAGVDYMLDPTTFLQVQNGQPTGLSNQVDPTPRYLHDARGLNAFTHVDVLYQAYFTAMQVLGTLKAPLNPGNPYVGNKVQNGFCTFGGPDIAASLGEIAARALDKVWYQKWVIHLTLRPEHAGGIAYQHLVGKRKIDAQINQNFYNSQALAQSIAANAGSVFLSQPFPEGSPAHPSYPTGHGTVGGACITLLKFFYDETWVIPSPMVPSSDGLSLSDYTGSDAGQITVGGELNKLASNVSYGHGVLAGIHWRTDTTSSMLLGEAMAISYLQDKAKTYNERFSVTFTKLDGNPVTITNQ